MNKIKRIILLNPIVKKIVFKLRKRQLSKRLYKVTSERISNIKRPGKVIFYLGIPAHTNLGDLAQGVCIRRWLKKNYSNYQIVEIETNALVNTEYSLLKTLKLAYAKGDIIVYQSGYTTTDLGGYADEMHRAVMRILPEADMLMLPQTIFFKDSEKRKRTAEVYNSMKHMLFLARDRVSYDMAKEMFPNIMVMQYPDIVTTLIGNYNFNYERDGIMFCCREDGEKFYSDAEIAGLMEKCGKLCSVSRTDTTKKGKTSDIVKNAETHIMDEIDKYAHYKAVITDRYHGTILSLVAGTPVIIIKTTDHKVITGSEWFKGVYDEYVYTADTLDEAYQISEMILKKELTHNLSPYFEKNYYDKLPEIFERID